MAENTCEWYDPSCALDWIGEELQSFSLWVWDGVLDGGVSLLEAIPVPDFLTNIGTQTLPAGLSWAASAFELNIGMTIVVSAYTARFILRRIPVIG